MKPFADISQEEQQIIKQILSHYGYDHTIWLAKCRLQRLVECKHVIWYYLRKKGYSLKHITEYASAGDHTTIINGVNRIAGYLESYPDFKLKIETLFKPFKNHFKDEHTLRIRRTKKLPIEPKQKSRKAGRSRRPHVDQYHRSRQ